MMMGFDSKTYNEALKQMWEWLDKQTGNSNSIKVEVKDNKTTVTLDDGRVGVARCNPCDKFDIVTGIRVALDDIERKSRKLSTLEKQMVNIKLGSEALYRSNCSLLPAFFFPSRSASPKSFASI